MIYPCGHDKPDQCERCDRRLISRRGFLRGAVGAAGAVIAAPVMIQVPSNYAVMKYGLEGWDLMSVGAQAWLFNAIYAIATPPDPLISKETADTYVSKHIIKP